MSIPTVGPHRVRRPFDFDGRRVIPGEIIDVTGWRNAYQLADRGYLVAVSESEIPPTDITPAKKPPAMKPPAKKPPAMKPSAKRTKSGD